MCARTQPVLIVLLASALQVVGASTSFGQSPPSATDHGVVPDDLLTLVVGTRFVAAPTDDLSAKTLFHDARIPLATFNETDDCIDQSSLKVAQDYFTTLGRVMGKAGHYYFVPKAEIEKSVTMCERLHGRPPQALTEKTKIIAFGKVVPTAEAPPLENSIR